MADPAQALKESAAAPLRRRRGWGTGSDAVVADGESDMSAPAGNAQAGPEGPGRIQGACRGRAPWASARRMAVGL